MKATSLLALLYGAIPFAEALIAAPRPAALERRDDSTTMDQLIAAYEETGMCFYYITTKRPSWAGAEQFPCIKYCKDKENSGYSECDISSYKDWDIANLPLDSAHGVMTDPDDNPFLPAPCKCSNEAVEELVTDIVAAVAEGLSKLDEILCAVGLSVFQTIADVGLMLIPGGQEYEAAKVAISSAKTFAENALDASDYFNWVGKACNLPDFNFDIWSILIHGPDTMGTSQGCKRKNKASCKEAPKGTPLPSAKPDEPKKTDTPTKSDASKESDSPKSDAPSSVQTSQSETPAPTSSGAQSSAQSSAVSSSASACQLSKRAVVPTPTLPVFIRPTLFPRADPPTDPWTEENTAECGDDDMQVQVAPQQLAAGSNGVIFKGTTHEGVTYALKGSDSSKAITNEYNMLKKTLGDHDNIIKVYSRCDYGTRSWFLMELGTGGDLESRIALGIYKENEALTKVVMAQIMNGVIYAHSKGIAHNDLKGGNVLFTEGDVAKVIDFGEATTEKTVKEIQVAGGIRSPEAEIDMKADIDPQLNDEWSLAVLMVRMLTNDKPWSDAASADARAIWEKPNTASARSEAIKKKWPQFTTAFSDVLATVFQPQSGRKPLSVFAAAIANPALQLIDDCNKKT